METINISDQITKNNANYFSMISAPVRYDKTLSANAKLIFGELNSLSTANGYAFCSNAYLSEIYGIDKKSVSRLISTLEEKGYISVLVLKDDNGTVIERRIFVNNDMNKGGIHNNVEGYPQKSGKVSTEVRRGIHSSVDYNIKTNTQEEHMSLTNEVLSEDKYTSFINYLNSNGYSSLNEYIIKTEKGYVITQEFYNNYVELSKLKMTSVLENINNTDTSSLSNKTDIKTVSDINLKDEEVHNLKHTSSAPENDLAVSHEKATRRTRKAAVESDDEILSNLSDEQKKARQQLLAGFEGLVSGSDYKADGKSPKKVKAAKKAASKKVKEPTPIQFVKDHYVENIKKLNDEGKLNILRPTVNSVPINSRMSAILKDVSPENLCRALDSAMADDFCVYTLQYDLQKLLSDKLINKLLNNLPKEEPKPAPMKNIQVKVCPKCNEPLNSFGTCSWCD